MNCQPIVPASRLFNDGPVKIRPYGLYPAGGQSIKIMIQRNFGQAVGGLSTDHLSILRAKTPWNKSATNPTRPPF